MERFCWYSCNENDGVITKSVIKFLSKNQPFLVTVLLTVITGVTKKNAQDDCSIILITYRGRHIGFFIMISS